MGVDPGWCCAGHIQSGDPRFERAIRYVPGLAKIEGGFYLEGVHNVNEGSYKPERYELDEKPVELDDLVAGAFYHYDNIRNRPLSYLRGRQHRGLLFTGSYLKFHSFTASADRTAELRRRLLELYDCFDGRTTIYVSCDNSFSIPAAEFNKPPLHTARAHTYIGQKGLYAFNFS